MDRLLLDTITLQGIPLEEKIRLAAAAGFTGLELRGADLDEWMAGGRTLDQLRLLLASTGLSAPAICTEADLWVWHTDFGTPAFHDALERFCEHCGLLGCRVLVFPVMSTAGDLPRATAHYAGLCDRLARWDLVCGLEFIGHVPKVPDIRTAWQMVRTVARPNGGIVCDLFHFYRGGSQEADLSAIPPERLAMIHLDDAMDLPREQLVGSRHRLYPGEGVVPLVPLLGAIYRNGYRGDFAVELFNPDYWSADPGTVAVRAWETSVAILARGREEAER